jgi:hypothetical protein
VLICCFEIDGWIKTSGCLEKGVRQEIRDSIPYILQETNVKMELSFFF